MELTMKCRNAIFKPSNRIPSNLNIINIILSVYLSVCHSGEHQAETTKPNNKVHVWKLHNLLYTIGYILNHKMPEYWKNGKIIQFLTKIVFEWEVCVIASNVHGNQPINVHKKEITTMDKKCICRCFVIGYWHLA